MEMKEAKEQSVRNGGTHILFIGKNGGQHLSTRSRHWVFTLGQTGRLGNHAMDPRGARINQEGSEQVTNTLQT